MVKPKPRQDKSTFCFNKSDKNNFDLIRIGLAFIVFLVHAAALSKYSSLNPILDIFSAEIAVKSFFVISGFLIFMSYENSNSTSLYFTKRIRRIYPAYAIVIIGSTLFGLFYTSLPLKEYLSFTTFKYLISNLLFLNFLQPSLPGLFTENPIAAVNGALWTLKIEVMFYVLVPLIAMAFNRIGHIKVIIGIYILSLLYNYVLSYFYEVYKYTFFADLQHQLPGQLTFFMMGASGYYFFEYFKKYSIHFLGASFFLLMFRNFMIWNIFEPAVLLILILFLATSFFYLGNLSRYGDFSYGIYILHFPVLQTLISLHLFKNSHWVFLIVSSATVILLSLLLWHFIERPFLKNNSHYLIRDNSVGQ